MSEHFSSTLYASLGLAGADGFFQSTDGGETWHNSFPGLLSVRTPLNGFALKPGDPQTIYLSGRDDTGDKFYRSTDGGEAWEVIWEGGIGLYTLGVSPADPEYVYVGSGDTILLSTNSGDTWDPAHGGIPADAEVSILAVHPVTPTVAYAGIEPGLVYKTVDGGGNWIQVADLGEGWWSALVIDPHAPDRLYATGWHTGHFFARSLDGGETWESMTLDPGSPSANDIEFHPTVSGTIYVIAPGVYRSVDAGATWEAVPVPQSASEGWALLLHPETGLPFYIGHNGTGVIRSNDGGANWETRNHGLAGLRPHEIAISPADPRYVYVAADESGGFSSHDGGQSWLSAVGDSLDRGISVAAHPYTPTIAFLGARRAVYKTSDGGQSWTRHELTGLPFNNEMRVHALAIDPSNPQVVYAGPGTWDFTGGPEHGWLYRSLDGGESWAELAITFPISPVTDIEIDPANTQTIYVSTGRRFLDSSDWGSGIIKTTDGGASWAFINQGLTARSISRLAIDPVNTQVLYAGACPQHNSPDSGVYKSANGGESWQHLVGELRASGLDLDPLDTATVYLGAYMDGLYRTTNGGASWQREDGPPGYLPIESLHITTVPSRTIIYVGVAGNLLAGETAGLEGLQQVYGGGVYQLTIDHRDASSTIYLPLVMRH
jgi:photosystem II stability/assembly factor-like uncharacterized protein